MVSKKIIKRGVCMLLFDLLCGADYEILAGGNIEITDVCIDSRKAVSGSLFVCLEGTSVNRHDFIVSAVKLGASAVICYEKEHEFPEGITVVYVEDARIAMNFIADNYFGHPAQGMKIYGVTGTNGKTSITYFLEEVLTRAGRKCGIIGTTGIVINGRKSELTFDTATSPDTYDIYRIFAEMKKESVTDVIMEITSHALALRKITNVSFDAAIFTNLTQDHFDYHHTFDNYRDAKAKLFKMCKLAVINSDDPYGEYMLNSSAGRAVTYGIKKKCGCRAREIKYAADGTRFTFSYGEADYETIINIPGEFTVYNVMAVITTALEIGIPVDIVKDAVSGLRGVPGRMQQIPNNLGIAVIVDYAHSPDGLKNIIMSVREFTDGRVIAVFGCGGDRDRAKRPIMGEIAGTLADYCVLTSDNPRSEEPTEIIREIEIGVKNTDCAYKKEADRREAISLAIREAQPGDSVIIAGKGHENYQEFEHGRRIFFDDVVIAAEILEGKN